MSRYDWPSRPASRQLRTSARRGQAAARRSYNLDLNAGFDAEQLVEARARRHTADEQSAVAAAAAAAGRRALVASGGGADDFVPIRAAPPPGGPGADRDLWLPVGPTVTLRGQADADPRVAGRIRDLAVSPDGQRAYAASALGGVWYTDTAGARWEPVGAWAMVTDRRNLQASSNTLTGGALHVVFDPANNPLNDEVWVGTGEPGRGRRSPFDLGTIGMYAGVGILRATGPVQTARIDPLRDPWAREAQRRVAPDPNPYVGLSGAGVFSLAANPANARNLVAATTRGLHHNGTALAPDPWAQVTVAAWEAIVAGASARAAVTDVAWTPATAAHPARLWVAVVDPATPALTDVWVSANGVTGPFAAVGLPGVAGTVSRLGIAADPAFPDVVYVLGSGPQIWRIDGLVPATVAAAPPPPAPLPNLFSGTFPNDQSDYDLAITIDPGNVNRIVVGGGAALSPFDNSWSAALYLLTVGGAAPAYTTDYVAGDANDARWIGAGVHADVHRLRWRQVAAASHVWVCCDGGIFRSTAAAARSSFVSRATGLAVTETGFIANHPVSDGIVLAGVQDNGVQLRIGESVWRRALLQGDAGGAAFDPGRTGRFAIQQQRSDWDDNGGVGISPSRRRTAMGTPAAGDSPAFVTEDGNSRFYSNATVIRRADGVTQLAIGTTRVWYSERWGFTQWDGVAGVWRRQWITLPTGGDPRAGNANDAATDLLTSGPVPTGSLDNSTGVRAVKWAGPDRLYVVMRGAIHRLDRNPPTVGAWASTIILIRPAPVAAPLPWPVAVATLPSVGTLNDLSVHDPTAGADGSFYVATSHPLEPVWWYDGQGAAGRWHPVRLGTPVPPAPPVPPVVPLPPDGVRAPAYSVVVDPDDPNIVYVGTAVGVWRGVLTLAGGPTWVWAPYFSGLPEAAVQDLVISTWPRPGGAPLKLLRAAVQSRGVWEVEPGQDATPTTYLRVHPYDSRRLTPTDLRDPMWNQPTPERDWLLDWADRRNRDFRNAAGQPVATPDGTPVGSFHWHGSPDIRLRPAAGGGAVPPAPALPWNTAPADRFWLWSLQTALRTIDPLIVPDGRWTADWRARLRAARVTLGIDPAPGLVRVNAALWNHPQVQAGFWADPWADGGPTEADLIERVAGAATPRVGGPTSRATSPASLAVLRRPYRVDVCLHHRGREPLVSSTLAVVLLRFQLPANAATWAALPTIALPPEPALTALRAALNALPPAGGPIPAELALPAGWAAADSGVAIRRPARPVATGAPTIVSFTVDFTGTAVGSRWLFLALAHSAADPLALTGATLRDLVLGSRHTAARSVQVV